MLTRLYELVKAFGWGELVKVLDALVQFYLGQPVEVYITLRDGTRIKATVTKTPLELRLTYLG